MPGPDLVARIDRIMAELAELRAEVAVTNVTAGTAKSADSDDAAVTNVTAADDLAAEHLIEVSTAVARFNRPADSLRWMCRKQNCGVKRGGRWMVAPARIERSLNGGG